jgi:hypothetical protein
MPAAFKGKRLRAGPVWVEADRSALVIGGTEKIRTGGATVFLKVVAVAEAVVGRSGRRAARAITRRWARWRTGWTRRPGRA